MRFPTHIQITIIVLGVLSAFWLPWLCTLALMFLAGLGMPLAALGIGVLTDLLYYPGHGVMWGTVAAISIAVGSACVRHLVKTRIM